MIKITKRKKGTVILFINNTDEERYFIIKQDKKPNVGEYLVAGSRAYLVTHRDLKHGYKIEGSNSWNQDFPNYYLGELA